MDLSDTIQAKNFKKEAKMIGQVLMEASLGRLVFGLTPEKTNKKLTYQDKYFHQVLGTWEKIYPSSITKVTDIILRIETTYQFKGLDKRPSGGYIAVFRPDFWIYRSDRDFGIGFQGMDPRLDELIEITQCKVVEADIPDIGEMKTLRITGLGSDNLVEGDSVWRIRK